MQRPLALFVIGAVFGGGFGFALAAANGITLEAHDHGNPAHHAGMDAVDRGEAGHAALHDSPIAVSTGAAPAVRIAVTPDPIAGHNLHVMVENFAFSPARAGLGHVPGQGHAHVYVDGVKRGRIYGAWTHLDTLPKGEVEVEVTLNSNDHRPFEAGGKPVSAKAKVVVE